MVSMFSGLVHLGYSERNAWRHSFALPACLLVLAAAGVLALGTDSPKVSTTSLLTLTYLTCTHSETMPPMYGCIYPSCPTPLPCLISYIDAVQGDFRDLRRAGHIRSKPLASIALATRRFSTWVLALQYALSFGTEVTLFNMAASYFVDRFHVRRHIFTPFKHTSHYYAEGV
jgi:hypothetical protein